MKILTNLKERILLAIGWIVSRLFTIEREDDYHPDHPYYEDFEKHYHD